MKQCTLTELGQRRVVMILPQVTGLGLLEFLPSALIMSKYDTFCLIYKNDIKRFTLAVNNYSSLPAAVMSLLSNRRYSIGLQSNALGASVQRKVALFVRQFWLPLELQVHLWISIEWYKGLDKSFEAVVVLGNFPQPGSETSTLLLVPPSRLNLLTI